MPENIETYLRDKLKTDEELKEYLHFDSMFECGNLGRVIALSQSEYNLYLYSDTNSSKQAQWFYFAVNNTIEGHTVKFNVMNQTRHPDLYKKGMKPLVYSVKNGMWNPIASNVTVAKIFIAHDSKDVQSGWLFSISFIYTFDHTDDRVYFAYSKPYSFTRLNYFLKGLENDLQQKENNDELLELPNKTIQNENMLYKREIICHSLGNIPLYAITITNKPLKNKQYIVLTARVHASETPGSFKIQGILQFLTGKSHIAESLRNKFIFLIIPMLNPDGVIVGNNRCSLNGFDLNRCWESPSLEQPTILAVKERLKDLVLRGDNIFVYCDLHGHSKLLNSFVYSCHSVFSAGYCSWSRARLLPRLLLRHSPFFDYRQCSFKVEADRLTTARVVVWKELKATNSFTLETSIYGHNKNRITKAFTEEEYFGIGEALMKALNEYSMLNEHIGKPFEWTETVKLVKIEESKEKSKIPPIRKIIDLECPSSTKPSVLTKLINDTSDKKTDIIEMVKGESYFSNIEVANETKYPSAINSRIFAHSKQRTYYKGDSVSEEKNKCNRRNLSMNVPSEAIDRKIIFTPKPRVFKIKVQKRMKEHNNKRTTSVPHSFLMNPKIIKNQYKRLTKNRPGSIVNRVNVKVGNKDLLRLDNEMLNELCIPFYDFTKNEQIPNSFECKGDSSTLKQEKIGHAYDYRMFMPKNNKSSDAFISNLLLNAKTKRFLFNSREKTIRGSFKLSYL